MRMSSGELPFATYHRASTLGSGTYGSVVVVYNDDGEEYALKLFHNDEDEDEEYDDEQEDESDAPPAARTIGLGALREISCLRLLRGYNAHPNVATLVDVQPQWEEGEAEGGAGTGGSLSIALPLYRDGSLLSALDKGLLRSCPKRSKVALAHGILSAVAYLHDNNIMHRDIKSDNICLVSDDETGKDCWRPVLIDFSCAKQMSYAATSKNDEPSDPQHCRHTGEVGTVTYTAPEVRNREPYGKPADLYSVGIVLLEILLEKPLEATKDRHAAASIEKTLKELGDQPFPNLLRGLLQANPNNRLTARQALEHSLFAKFGFEVPEVRKIDIATALPLDFDSNDEESKETENKAPNNNHKATPSRKKLNNSKRNGDRVLEKRTKFIDSVCRQLKSQNSITPKAALEYSRALSLLDETVDDVSESQSLLNCIVLAHKFFELDMLDLEELDDDTKGPFANWTLEDYVDDEATLFMVLDFCLYPRFGYNCTKDS